MGKSIGFIGAGRVGTSLGKYLALHGFKVSGYYSRTMSSAEDAAEFSGGVAYADISELIASSDIIFITVNDDAIPLIDRRIGELPGISGKLFCHTSGVRRSTELSEIMQSGGRCCSAHMLLAVNDRHKSYRDFEGAHFTVEGDCAEICDMLKKCGNGYTVIRSECKVKYHAAAVFASNFICGMTEIACELLTDCGFEYEDALRALTPLILNNVNNIIRQNPREALTGPVARGDFETVKLHMKSLEDDDSCAAEVYRSVTRALLRQTNQERQGEF